MVLDVLSFNTQKRKHQLEMLKPLINYYKDKGLDVGVWFWALWRQDIEYVKDEMDIITSFDGKVYSDDNDEYGKTSSAFFCPSSKKFISNTCEFVRAVAELNPDIIYYKNNLGQKFVVFAFDAYTAPKERYRSYTMQKLLNKYNDILGKSLPVKCEGNPDLYVLCKKNNEGMAIGLWNFSPDKIDKPIINLSENFNSARFINCEGCLNDKKIIIESCLHSFEFCFINLK